MLRLSMVVTKKDRIRNENIKGILKLDGFGNNVNQLIKAEIVRTWTMSG